MTLKRHLCRPLSFGLAVLQLFAIYKSSLATLQAPPRLLCRHIPLCAVVDDAEQHRVHVLLRVAATLSSAASYPAVDGSPSVAEAAGEGDQ